MLERFGGERFLHVDVRAALCAFAAAFSLFLCASSRSGLLVRPPLPAFALPSSAWPGWGGRSVTLPPCPEQLRAEGIAVVERECRRTDTHLCQAKSPRREIPEYMVFPGTFRGFVQACTVRACQSRAPPSGHAASAADLNSGTVRPFSPDSNKQVPGSRAGCL